MTLQEAFRTYRGDVIVSSRQRMRSIKAKETRRQLAKEMILQGRQDEVAAETELYKAIAERLDYETKRHVFDRHRELVQKNRRYARFDELATPGVRRPITSSRACCGGGGSVNSGGGMSTREIKERTRRKYEKLPEVQQKLLREKLEESKAKNRIKSNIFKKVKKKFQIKFFLNFLN